MKILPNTGAFREITHKIVPFIALLLLIVVFSALAPTRFATVDNAITILVQSVVLCTVAFGSTLVIMTGAIDLSVGSVVALTGMAGAMTAQTMGGGVGFVVALAVGALCGVLNGIGLAYLRIPSFIMTLGMLSIARGLTLLISGTQPAMIPDGWEFMGIEPGIFLPAAVVFIVTYFILRYTALGRYIIAVGGKEDVAAMSGVRINQVKLAVFIISGMSAAVGGVVLASWVGAATPTAGTGMELTVIAAVVLGGTPLTGGMGSIVNTAIGAIIIDILLNGLIIMGVGAELQVIAQGLVLILAVLVSLDRKKIGVIK